MILPEHVATLDTILSWDSSEQLELAALLLDHAQGARSQEEWPVELVELLDRLRQEAIANPGILLSAEEVFERPV